MGQIIQPVSVASATSGDFERLGGRTFALTTSSGDVFLSSTSRRYSPPRLRGCIPTTTISIWAVRLCSNAAIGVGLGISSSSSTIFGLVECSDIPPSSAFRDARADASSSSAATGTGTRRAYRTDDGKPLRDSRVSGIDEGSRFGPRRDDEN